MKKENIIKIVAIILACLFVYAALSKLEDYHKSVIEMRNQVFPTWIAMILTWLIPTIELFLVALLIIPITRKMAVWLSLFLLTTFTIYIAIVMTGVFGRIPCSCGGILENMSYGIHLIFNLFFIVIALLGLGVENRWMNNNRLFNLKKRKDFLQSSV